MEKLRILLAEDEPLISIFFAELLVEMGYEVCAIEVTEDAAVEAAARLRPDLLIVDRHLKQGSGIVAVARILQEGPVPYIFMTGDRLVREEVPANAIILQKPFLDADVGEAIHTAMRATGRPF
ncbi:MAG: response regulator [Rhizobium sp.]|nr:response regulator [Rhizobium sp.]